MSIRLNNPEYSEVGAEPYRHRFHLVSFVLLTILISIIGIGLLLTYKTFDASNMQFLLSDRESDAFMGAVSRPVDSVLHRHHMELAGIAQVEKKEYREFFLKICQMILLNLLLPILTATLGYNLGRSKPD